MSRWGQRLAGFAAVIGLTAAVAGIISSLFFTDPVQKEPSRQTREQTLDRRLDDTIRQVRRLEAEVNAQTQLPAGSEIAAQLARTQRRVRALSADLTELRDAIAPDPVKALRVAFLQRDVRRVESSNEASIESMRADVDRQYDLMKFIVGTLAIGIIGLIVSVVVPAIRGQRVGPSGGTAEP